MGKSLDDLDEGQLQFLKSCRWPGNIRQLKGTIHRLVLLAGSSDREGSRVDFGDLPEEFWRAQRAPAPSGETSLSIEEAEKRHIEMALSRWKGVKSMASRELGITRQTLANKIKKYRLQPSRLA
jgi:transcriptional regulator with PAS, ATPase and Fis domain